MIWFFLSSGIFLGWSLGANDAANIFGTAVGTRMVRFRTAAIITCIFLALGAVISGAGTSHTLGKLGAVNALAGSFTVALVAGSTVAWMTRAKLPVSTSQAVVGAIVGWNFFTGSPTEWNTFSKIVSTWFICPVLAAIFAYVLYRLARFLVRICRFHLLREDALTRWGLVVAGAFGAYSLGANNIANVMGVFVPAKPFDDIDLGFFVFTGTQSLFLLGAIAIGVGVVTFSRSVMMTVGSDLLKLTPLAALVVVIAQSLVLFLFASRSLEAWLSSHGLPTIPLVPVSSSQAVIGAVIGIGFTQGIRNLDFKVLGRIASGSITTPVFAGVLSFVALFFVQNVFQQQVVTRDETLAVEAAMVESEAPVEPTAEAAATAEPEARPETDAPPVVEPEPDAQPAEEPEPAEEVEVEPPAEVEPEPTPEAEAPETPPSPASP